jgi:ADP-ribose pyrophosphatase YjhB (NUDIX family)
MCTDEAGRVLLVREAPGEDAAGHWGLPGGGVEHGEAPRDGVVREFAEETGLTIEVLTLREVISDLHALHAGGWLVHTDRVIYDVRITGGTLRNELDGSSDLVKWYGPAEVPGLKLLRYAALALGVKVTDRQRLPESVPPDRATMTRVQRFAAYGVVTDPAGRVLLSKIAKGYPGAGRWHLPGGGTDFGEQPREGLLREIVEETAQRGRVVGLLDVTDLHNPGAFGPEKRTLDWHTVRSLWRVVVDDPSEPRVIEEAGGSTAESAWFEPSELPGLAVNDFARGVLRRYLS